MTPRALLRASQPGLMQVWQPFISSSSRKNGQSDIFWDGHIQYQSHGSSRASAQPSSFLSDLWWPDWEQENREIPPTPAQYLGGQKVLFDVFTLDYDWHC